LLNCWLEAAFYLLIHDIAKNMEGNSARFALLPFLPRQICKDRRRNASKALELLYVEDVSLRILTKGQALFMLPGKLAC